jgi:hypothetical protein
VERDREGEMWRSREGEMWRGIGRERCGGGTYHTDIIHDVSVTENVAMYVGDFLMRVYIMRSGKVR